MLTSTREINNFIRTIESCALDLSGYPLTPSGEAQSPAPPWHASSLFQFALHGRLMDHQWFFYYWTIQFLLGSCHLNMGLLFVFLTMSSMVAACVPYVVVIHISSFDSFLGFKNLLLVGCIFFLSQLSAPRSWVVSGFRPFKVVDF
jgi:hypothetical protein